MWILSPSLPLERHFSIPIISPAAINNWITAILPRFHAVVSNKNSWKPMIPISILLTFQEIKFSPLVSFLFFSLSTIVFRIKNTYILRIGNVPETAIWTQEKHYRNDLEKCQATCSNNTTWKNIMKRGKLINFPKFWQRTKDNFHRLTLPMATSTFKSFQIYYSSAVMWT